MYGHRVDEDPVSVELESRVGHDETVFVRVQIVAWRHGDTGNIYRYVGFAPILLAAFARVRGERKHSEIHCGDLLAVTDTAVYHDARPVVANGECPQEVAEQSAIA